jgi:hypothetical protein
VRCQPWAISIIDTNNMSRRVFRMRRTALFRAVSW